MSKRLHFFMIFIISLNIDIANGITCGPPLTGNVDENEAIGTAVTLDFTCTGFGGNTPSYALSGTTAFSLPSSASLSLVTAAILDTESTDVHSFTLTVTAGTTATFTVSITANDVNEYAPACSPSGYYVTVDENTGSGAAVATVTCTDADHTDAISAYSLSGDDVTPKFSLTSNSIVTSSTALDYETKQSYVLYVDVVDTLATQLTGTATVYVQVGAVNEHTPAWASFSPSWTSATTPYDVTEDSAVGTSIVTIAATDTDDGVDGDIVYSIVSVTDSGSSSASSMFRIDASSGELESADTFDYESSITYYDVVVQASDSGSSPNTITRTVRVGITDVNDNTPAFSQNIYDVSIAEDSSVDTSVLQLVATDADAGSTLTYSITTGNSAGKFQMDSTNTDTIELAAVIDLDSGVSDADLYTLTVQVSDGTYSASATVYVQVTTANSNSPTWATFTPAWTSATTPYDITETSAIGTSVVTIAATDIDDGVNGDVVYSIVSVTDSGGSSASSKFRIDASSGELDTADTFDYESSITYYDVVVQASDSGSSPNTITRTVRVGITDVNDNTPAFSQNIYDVSIAEDSSVDTSVLQLVATDADAGSSLTYSITAGNSAGKFQMDSTNTDTIELAAVIDLDSGVSDADLYTLTVQVSDGTYSASATVYVQVTTANSNSPTWATFTPAWTSATTPYDITETSAIGTSVVTIAATDIDDGVNGDVVYSIVSVTNSGGSSASSKFRIDASSGELDTADTFDYESSITYYDVVVQASDSGSSPNTITRTVRVGITDVNDNTPAFSQNIYDVSIAEDSSVDTSVLQLVATDADAGSTLTYSITTGNSAGKFQMDSTNTDTIELAAVIDLDSGVSDADLYTLTVQVSDGTYSASATVYVQVTTANSNSPTWATFTPAWTSATTPYDITETSAIGTSVVTIATTDIDDGVNGDVVYSIVSVTDSGGSSASSKFRIDASSGELDTADTFDYESSITYYDVVVQASDSGSSPNTITRTVRVGITDVNDNTPAFSQNIYDVSIAEDSSVDTSVLQLVATDADAGSTLTYSIIAGNSAGKFQMDSTNTDTIELAAVIDLDSGVSDADLYTLTVQVSDGTYSASATVYVQVTTTNSNSPTWATFTPAWTSATTPYDITESSAIGTSVVTIAATDIDDGVNGDVVYSIVSVTDSGGSSASSKFRIDALSGELDTADTFDYESSITYYDVVVQASDSGSSPNTITRTVRVGITDVNDNTPAFSQNIYDVSIAEDSSVDTSVLQLVATDADAGSTLTYSIIAGNSAGKFQMDSTNTDTIELAAVIDLDSGVSDADLYTLTVQVSDGTYSASATVYVQVTTTNSNSPTWATFTPAWTSATTPYDITESSAIGTSVVTIAATDIDDGVNGDVVYSIVSVTDSGGSSASSKFRIDASSGELDTADTFDYESSITYYDVVVQASDSGSSPNTITRTVRVGITDVNDNTPAFSQNIYDVSIAEDSSVDTSVLQLVATDADAGSTLTYSITAGNSAGKFQMDSTNTDTIELAAVIDLDSGVSDADLYTLTVQVSDGTYSASATVYVQVTTANSNSPTWATFTPAWTSATTAYDITETSAIGTSVVTIAATDIDDGVNGDVVYSIVSVTDSGGSSASSKFRIDASSGELDTADTFDYESSITYYDVVVQASDSGSSPNTITRTVRVGITDVNDNTPAFSQNIYDVSIAEDSSVDTSVLQLVATDADAGSTLTYSITAGNSAGKFQMDSTNTDTIELAAVIDLDSGVSDADLYTLTVQVSDGTYSVSATVYVQVTTANSNSPTWATFTPAWTSATTPYDITETSAIGTSVVTIAATDIDDGVNGDVVYSIVSVTDSGGSSASSKFRIDASSGELDTADTFDYESSITYYDVVVQASDSGSSPNTITRTVRVGITDVNDNTPAFGQNIYDVSIAEDSSVDTSVLQLVATDADAGSTLTYSITAGNSAGKFQMDSTNTDTIELAAVIDLDSGVSDADLYTLTVQVSDGTYSASATVYVQVTTANSNSPTWATFTPAWTSATTPYDITETSAIGTSVVTIAATDIDDGVNGDVVYSIVSVTDSGGSSASSKFRIDASSGELDTADTFDYESSITYYDVVVQASDSGSSPNTITRTVRVGITDVNDNTPAFSQNIYDVSIAEDSSVDTSVLQLVATDADAGSTLTYSITAGNSAGKFQMDSTNTDTIELAAVIDLDSGVSDADLYTLTVQVSDGTYSASATVYVQVTTANSNSPTWATFTPAWTSATTPYDITETSAIGTSVVTIAATDIDDGVNGDVVYSIVSVTDSGGSSASSKFRIDASSGELDTADTFDYESSITYYDVVVQASDSGSLPNTITRTVRVGITDVNDNTPAFSQNIYDVSIAEDSSVDTSVLQLVATDADAGSTLTYSITAGNSAGKFQMDSTNTDTIELAAVIDLDSGVSDADLYTLTAQVSDGTYSASATVYVQVTTANSNSPTWATFTPAWTSATTAYDITETSAIGTSVVTIAATDIDDGVNGDVVYSIVSVTDSGGSSASSKFRIDASSGELDTADTFDYESSITYYDVVVQASDSGSSPNTITRTVRVGITDVNDNTPAFSQNIYDVSIAEDSSVDTSVLQLVATDADAGSTLTYSITAGNSAGKFQMDSTNTDTIELAAVIDLDSGVSDADLYTLTVQVSDGTYSASATVYVQVTTANSNSPTWATFTPAWTSATTAYDITETSAIGTSVVTIAATDIDDGVNGDVVYSIVSVTDSGGSSASSKFRIDASSGELDTADTFDYESSITYYDVVVQASDSGSSPNTITRTVRVGITDVNDNTPAFSQNIYDVSIAEDSSVDTSVLQLVATDADAGSTLTYSITAGNSAGKFQMDSTNTDTIELAAVIDLDSGVSDADLYTLTVQVSDGTYSASATVYVQVTTVNDNTPTWSTFTPNWSSATTSYDVTEDSAIGSSVVTISATDTDVSVDGVIVYSLVSVTESSSSSALSKFRVDGISGEVAVTGTLDFETITYYDLVVKASDGGSSANTATRSLRVGVTDVNDNDPVFSQSVYDATTTEGNAVGTSVLQLTATDDDAGSTMIYSIISGNADGKFQMSTDTIEIAAIIDLDSGSADAAQYTLTVQVSDGTNSQTAALYVSVDTSNDHDPTFGTPGVNNIPENSPVEYSVGSVSATDDDYGDDGSLTYTITAGDTNNNFVVDPLNGVIYLSSPVDYDTITINPVILELTATDDGSPPRSATVSVTASVLGVNDNSPTCTQYSYSEEINENAAVNDQVLALNCSDADGDTLTYGIFSGNVGNDFSLSGSGILTVANALDYDASTTMYGIVLHVKDDSNTHTTSVAVSVSIAAINEATPAFGPVTTTLTLAESLAVTSQIVTKSATDSDASPHCITLYAINSVSPGTTDRFMIDKSSGQITLAKLMDYADSPYEIVVVATDGGGLTGTGTVSIIVTDVNDHTPECDPAAWNLEVAEDASTGVLISDLQCTDGDNGTYGTITYSMTQSPGSGDFTVDSSTGVVSLAATQDYESGQTFYSLEVTAADDGGSGNSVVVPISVTITAVNEGAPVFTGTFSATVAEDAAVGTSVLDVTATDVDGNVHPHGKRYYSITAGNTNDKFQISPTTGRILTSAELDRETISSYSLTVMAVEEVGTNSATVVATVTISDVEDNAPVCTNSVFAVDVDEDVSTPYTLATLGCTDSDSSSTLSYSLSAGDSSVFSVLNDVVNVATSLDYDLGTQKYALTVTVSDDATPPNTVDIKGSVNVLPINEFTPTFTSSGLYVQSVDEDETIGTVILTVVATDQDSVDTADGQVVYSVVSGSTPKFILDSNSGDITLARSLDRETVDQYILKVEGSDGTLSSTATVTINVNDINDNAPVFNPRAYSTQVSENTTVGSVLLTVAATDADDPSTANNGAIVYSITAGNTGGEFAIDTNNGQLSLQSSLDYESAASYALEITVKDKSGAAGGLSDIANAIIKIDGTNEDTPTFTSSTYTASLLETVTIGSFAAQVIATDSDDGNDGSVYYAMATNAYFLVDSETGNIYVKSALNYEVDMSHTLTITAYDRGTDQNSADATVTISVQDENDNAPECAPRMFSVTVREDDPIGTVLSTMACTDDDSGLAGTLDYSIASVNGNPGSGDFTINSTGILMIDSDLDYETDETHEIIVNVFDTSVAPLTTTVLVVVSLTDVNEHAPTFSAQPSTVSIAEDVTIGTSILTITATDLDTDDTIAYSLSPSSPFFSIDPFTGEIKLKSSLDHENETTIVLGIEALDSGSVDSARSSSHSLTVTVTDVNDEDPIFTPGAYVATLGENDAAGQTVVSVTATDSDSGSYGDVSYSIYSGNADSVFRIDLNVPLGTGDIIIDSTSNLDYETVKKYYLTVLAVDGGGNNATSMVALSVDPYNEHSPQFTPSSTYSVSWLENTAIGTLVDTVLATDADDGSDGEVTYHITSGGSNFEIDKNSGNVSLSSLLDRETTQVHTVLITATDGGTQPGALTSTSTLSVTVLDYNDNSPVCTPYVFVVSLPENTTSGDSVVSISCTDADQDPANINNQISFRLDSTIGSSNFEVDNTTGQVMVSGAASIDYESVTSYSLAVLVEDQGIPALTSTVSIAVEITGINEHDPVFGNATYEYILSEDTSVGSSIGQVVASDSDDGKDGSVYYTITGGSSGKFHVDPLSGDIQLTNHLDREVADSYVLTVEARDYGSPSLTGSSTVNITVTDVNDVIPTCTQSLYSTAIDEHSANDNHVLTIICSDFDDGLNGVLQFSITDGNIGNAFQINSSTGEVTVLTDSAVDNDVADVVSLIILVEDSSSSPLNTTVILVVTINDVNEHSPQFDVSAVYDVNVNENDPIGTSVIDVNATDDDSGENGEIAYSILSGDPSDLFHIDPVTGLITLQGQLDLLTQGIHILTIEGTDHASPALSSEVNVTVNVDDYNNNYPVFTKEFYTGDVDEDASSGISVLTIAATDADADPLNSQIQYSIVDGDPDTQFSININSGQITVSNALDYETNTTHHLTIRANDLGSPSLSSTVQATVTINPVNEFYPNITIPSGGYTVDIYENITAETIIMTITSTDDDDGQHGVPRYSITAGNTQNNFDIGESSGNIFVTGILDREATDSYTLTVRATDSLAANGDELFNETDVTISILDVNDNYPTFVPSVYSVAVLEGAVIGSTVATFTILDDDIGINALYDIHFSSGNTGEAFNISGNDVILAGDIDHEVNSRFDLLTVVEDQGYPTLSSTAKLIVNVLSENEYSPIFDSENNSLTIFEDIAVGSIIFDVNATDQDENTAGVLKYYIESGNPGDTTFLIDQDSGKIKIGSYLDYDTTPTTYDLNITTYDNAGENPYLMDWTMLTIILEDVNDNTPTFTKNTYTQAIDENIADDVLVETVLATDIDSELNGLVTFSIDGGDGNGQFNLNTSSGEITTVPSHTIDRELKSTYTLLIKARDHGSPMRSSYCIVKITINDINDNDPDFTPDDFTSSLNENLAPNTLVTSVYATDSDIGNNGLLTFSLNGSSDPQGHFSLVAVGNDTAEIYTTTVLDRESTEEYTLIITAVDFGTPPRTGTATVRVVVEDLNDNTPVISGQPYSNSIYEDVNVGTTVFSIVASDADKNMNSWLNYAIVSGDHDDFKIDPDTGVLSTKSGLDREEYSIYYVVVEVEDNGASALTATTTATVTILDINDNIPQFTEHFNFTIQENVANSTFVGQVQATDIDDGVNAAIQYSLIQTKIGHEDYFRIEPATGSILTANDLLDREDQDYYILTIRASDGGSPMRFSEIDVTVYIGDLNDNYPSCTQTVFSGALSESDNPGKVITTVMGEDKDIGRNANLTYDILNSTAAAYFDIDAESGRVTIRNLIDREATPTFTFDVVVTDDGISKLSVICVVQVGVSDLNDNYPVFSQSFYDAEVAINSPPDVVIVQLQATDADKPPNNIIEYQLQTQQDNFEIDAFSGNITKVKEAVLQTEVTIVLEVIAKDAGVPSKITSVLVRIDTFDEEQNVVVMKLAMTQEEFQAKQEAFLQLLQATLSNEYPDAVVKIWKVEEIAMNAEITSNRRRLLQQSTSNNYISVHLYAMNGTVNSTQTELEKSFISAEKLLTLWSSDSSGIPGSSISGELFEQFGIEEVVAYKPAEVPWWRTETGQIVLITTSLVLVVLILTLIVYFCYCKNKNKPRGRKDITLVVPFDETNDLSCKDKPKMIQDDPNKKINSNVVVPVEETEKISPWTVDGSKLGSKKSKTTQAKNKPLSAQSTDTVYDATAIDPVTGRMYEYNSLTFERRWVRDDRSRQRNRNGSRTGSS